MNVVVNLAPDSAGKKPDVGEVLKLQIFIDEKIGSPGDGWEIDAPQGTLWQPAGSVTASVMSVRSQPADGNATKLEFEAMVHQPGPLFVGPLLVRNQVTKAEVEVPQVNVGSIETFAGEKPKEEPPWLQPSVGFGGWDWTLLGLLLAVFFALALVGVRIFLRKLRSHLERNLTNTERALHALANLQKYARAKKPLQLEEWKKFSFELAGILRKYADINFHMDTRDMTDRELLVELRTHSTAAPQVNLLGNILGTITEVRYGRKELDASVVPGLLLDSRKFVETTSLETRKEEKR
jgi:hypothetical protein